MFWGWYSFGNGRRSSGCFFLPFLCICGSLFWFSGFNSRFIVPLILLGLLALIVPALLNQGRRAAYGDDWTGGLYDSEKPKRDFDEKPKRVADYLVREDGDVLEVIDHPREPGTYDYDEDV